jgi:hypothetical protein
MHRASLPLASLVTATALVFSGCSDLPPGQPGMFANDAAVAGGSMARAGGTMSAEAQAGGYSTGAMVAQERARVAITRLRKEQERAITAAPKPKTKAPAPEKPSGAVAMKAKEVDVTRIEPKKKKKIPRYIAVDTVKDERTSPQAARAVMIFDTQTQEIVGNDVYDVRSTPPVGGTARFETFTAEYVGSGG